MVLCVKGMLLGIMTRINRHFVALLISAILISSCSTSGGYWVPPHATEPNAPAFAMIGETPPAQLSEPTALPENPIGSQPADQVVEVQAPAPTSQITPTIPPVNTTPILYYVQAADTLPVVAVRFGVSPDEITSPDPLPEQDFLNPGQLLVIPRRLANTTASIHLIPDSEIVFSPSAINFDIHEFVNQAGGKLSRHSEWFRTSSTIPGSEIVLRVATENSINPRLLLTLLEYQSNWVYGEPTNLQEEEYPMGAVDARERGLYNQLVWAVNQLSIGYYAYREGRLTEIRFKDGLTARLAPDLNAGTVALQYLFAQLYSGQEWLDALDPVSGLPGLHERMFGNPWERARTVEPLFPPGIVQPPLTLPFARGNWVWAFTGGPHGAWEHDGAYAALDFAPGSIESGCVPSYAWVTASSSGLVVRAGYGVVVLDLDGDGYEQTGWVLLYLHLSNTDRVKIGDWVDESDRLGHPSCEGGISTGTHLHIARKYNGEWIPADGPLPFNLGGWVAHAGDAAYKGTLVRDGNTVNASVFSSHDTLIRRGPDDP